MPVKLILADDHPLVLSSLKTVINSQEQMEVVGSYCCGSDLLNGLKTLQPDVLMLDMQLPDMTGKELAETILNVYPSIKIIVLTALEATYNIEEMMQLGCAGYLLKSSCDDLQLIKAIEDVYRGEYYLDTVLQKQLLTNILKKKRLAENVSQLLTRREKEILKLITEEYTNMEIAEKLNISIRTVETHRFSLLQKLNAKNTAGLVRSAIEMRLI
jgi:DNA-binding NarL/FixJ family response regulator